MKLQHLKIDRLVLAAASGLLLTAAFPKPHWHAVAWIALVPLLAAIRRLKPGESFRVGLIAGLIHYFTLLFWVVPFLQTFAYFPWYLAVPVLVLFAAFLGLFPATFAAGLACCRRSWTALFAIPVFWVALEQIRGWILSGFPWALLGYSQVNQPHLIQIADIFGVYGVSFLVAALNGVVFFSVLKVAGWQWRSRPMGGKTIAAALIIAMVMVGGTFQYGRYRLAEIDAVLEKAPTANTAVIQGNVSQDLKWDPTYQHATIEKYNTLSKSALKETPELIVWPETATPFYFPYDQELSAKVLEKIPGRGATYLIGSPSVFSQGDAVHYYNSAFLIGPDADIKGRYDKVHLVPFGEYVPAWMPFVGKIVVEAGEFSVGEKGRVLPWSKGPLGMLICYEGIFPDLSRAMVKNGAVVLVNITNDAWYGRSWAPYQHFVHMVFRAVENRRALVRAANTGISGFIDPAGRVSGTTELFEDAVATHPVPLLKMETVYTRHGDWFALVCLAMGGLLFITNLIKYRKEHEF
jgi:apolipoprotein N-acyltransferase